ncbi:MAG TPA: hypothetical protein VFS43_25975 [Polyangiaceae bacterium]|nr:hypothetical protein [Polyangiaceae bacterium]
MSVDLARRLLSNGLLQREDAQRLLLAHVLQGTPFLKLVLDLGLVPARLIDDEFERADVKGLRRVYVNPELVGRLPLGLCHRLWALPLRRVPSGGVDAAALDPFDRNVALELSFHLEAPVRVFRAPLEAMAEALRSFSSTGGSAPSRRHPARPTPPYAEPAPGATPPAIPRWSALSSAPPIPLVRPRFSSSPEGPKFPPPPPVPSVAWGAPPAEGAAAEGGAGVAPGARGPASRGEPPTVRGPGATFADIGSSLSALRQARSRDEVVEHLVAGLRTVARRVAVFAVRQGEFRGWQCNEAFGDAAAFRRVVISAGVPSVLATAAAVGHYLGPVPRTPSHEALLGVMGGAAGEVAVMPVVVGGRAVLFALLDEVVDSLLATRRAEDLGRLAGEVLGRLVRRDKAGERG